MTMKPNIEVVPGMFSLAITKPSLKTPIVMIVGAFTTLIGFSLFGKKGDVKFVWSVQNDFIRISDLVVNAKFFCLMIGLVLLTLASASLILFLAKKKTPMYLNVIFGILFLMALLGWLAADSRTGVLVYYILSSTVVFAIPLIFGGMAGIMSERVGVVNIAIEGQLLTGAFVSAVVGSLTKNLYIGLVAAMIAAGLVSMILAALAIKYLVEQIIIGVLLNVLVIGVTNFLYSAWIDSDKQHLNSPTTFKPISVPVLSQIPIIGQVLFDTRITVYLMLIIVPVLWFVLFKTKLGLRARSVGENPLAADTVGINVARTRFWWVTLGGMVAGLGGAALSIGDVGSFGKEMTAGQGFIALAVVILGRWQPIYVSLGALLFGFTLVLRVWANQVSPGFPTDLITMAPYLVTLIAVAGFAGKVRAPAAVGKPYEKG